MSRTPSPIEFHTFQTVFEPELRAHIEGIRLDSGRSVTDVIFRELEFIRTWGLTATRFPLFRAKVKSANSTEVEFVKRMVADYVATLPAAKPPPSSKLPPPVRLGFNLSGPAHALVMRYALDNDLEMTPAIRALLEFARTYGLPDVGFSALNAEAKRRGATPRDLVLDLIADSIHAEALAAPTPPRSSSRRPRKHV